MVLPHRQMESIPVHPDAAGADHTLREDSSKLVLRRRYEAQAYATQARGQQAKNYYPTKEARDPYIPWFQAHQNRAQ